MSFMYAFKISISRPATNNTIGAVDYQVLEENEETLIISGVAANIQQYAVTKKQAADLPGDIYVGMRWRIFFFLPKGTVKDNDIITDEDDGTRYQVTAAYWNSMGYNCKCERLQN